MLNFLAKTGASGASRARSPPMGLLEPPSGERPFATNPPARGAWLHRDKASQGLPPPRKEAEGLGWGGLRRPEASGDLGGAGPKGDRRQLGLEEVLLSWKGRATPISQEHTYFILAMALGGPH